MGVKKDQIANVPGVSPGGSIAINGFSMNAAGDLTVDFIDTTASANAHDLFGCIVRGPEKTLIVTP